MIETVQAHEVFSVISAPEKTLQLAYVIPIRAELGTGNFFRQLAMFSRQTTRPENFEVLYAINNKPEDKVTTNTFYQENENTLSIISYIRGLSTTLPELTDWQRGIVEDAKERGLRIQGIALTTDAPTSRAPELARVHAENIAFTRFMQGTFAQSDGVIVTFDGDTFVDGDTTHLLVQQMKDPQVGMLRITYDLTPGEGGELLYKTTAAEQFTNTTQVLGKVFEGSRSHYWYAAKAGALGMQDEKAYSAMQRDDTKPQKGDIRWAADVHVRTQDRARPANIGGQFGSKRLSELPMRPRADTIEPITGIVLTHNLQEHARYYAGHYHQEVPAHILEILARGITHVFAQHHGEIAKVTDALVNRKPIDLNYIGYLLQQVPEYTSRVTPQQYADTIQTFLEGALSNTENEAMHRYIQQEVAREEVRNARSQEFVHNLVAIVARQPLAEATTLIDAFSSRRGPSTGSVKSFLTANRWIIERVRDAVRTQANTTEAYARLTQDFGDFLLPLDKTTYSHANAQLQGIIHYIFHALEHKDAFPITSVLFGFE